MECEVCHVDGDECAVFVPDLHEGRIDVAFNLHRVLAVGEARGELVGQGRGANTAMEHARERQGMLGYHR
jgi:hypothetical protein